MAANGSDGDIEFAAIARSLWRRRNLIIWPTIIVASLAAVGVNMVMPRYKSEARVLYEGRENVFMRPEAEKSQAGQTVGDQEAIANQVQLAMSREVAGDVIKELKLEKNPEFDPVLGGISPVKYLSIFFGLSRDPFQMTPDERVLGSYYDKLTAYSIDKSRVIVIEFQSANPELAAQIANAIAENYIARRQLAKQDQSRGAGQWLAGEIEKLRARVAEAEARTEAFRAKNNLFVGPNNTTLSNQQLGEFNTQLGAARAQKADAETRARAIRDMLRKGEQIESSDIANSELMRRLSEQRVTLLAQLAEQSATLLDNHPRIKELKAQVADLDRQIHAEAEKLVRSLENDARIAGSRVEMLTAQLDGLKRQAASTNEQDVQLRALDRESKAQRDLLESYLAKYREATARETIGTAPPADARVISRASVSNTPYFPKKMPIVLVAALATFTLCCGFGVTAEFLRAGGGTDTMPLPHSLSTLGAQDESRYRPPALRARHPALGVSIGAISDVARRLRDTAGLGRRIAVFAAEPGQAPGLGAITLARALANDARTVLLDLAPGNPNFAAVSSEPHAPGLADLVKNVSSYRDILTRDRLSRLQLVGAGQSPMDWSALVAAPRFAMVIDALARSYDYLLIDAQTLPDAAAARLATFAPRAVLFAGEGSQRNLRHAYERLAGAGFVDVAVVTIAGAGAMGASAAA